MNCAVVGRVERTVGEALLAAQLDAFEFERVEHILTSVIRLVLQDKAVGIAIWIYKSVVGHDARLSSKLAMFGE
jgi:hypothetical protein